ncbi:MAG: S-layer family protein, partial [Leptolyngbya sp. SIO4C5]|nr:S-layer family protein [Leptolyngbya sp. SIO4C5]
SDIRTNVAIAFDDSDILANARDGRGGNITFNVQGFFGENFTPASANADPDTLDGNDRVDVNATGAVNGVVAIPNVSFIENSLTRLPDSIVPTDQVLAGSCISRAGDEQGSFVVTGGGGLPVRPSDNLPSTYSTGDVQALPNTPQSAQWQPGDNIVEPTGVFELSDGRLVLSRECSVTRIIP